MIENEKGEKKLIWIPERKLPEPVNPRFHVSHAKCIKLADGQVLELNRQQRRRAKIYNRDLVHAK